MCGKGVLVVAMMGVSCGVVCVSCCATPTASVVQVLCVDGWSDMCCVVEDWDGCGGPVCTSCCHTAVGVSYSATARSVSYIIGTAECRCNIDMSRCRTNSVAILEMPSGVLPMLCTPVHH